MKKVLSIAIVLVLAVSFMVVGASAHTFTYVPGDNDPNYTTENGSVETVNFEGTKGVKYSNQAGNFAYWYKGLNDVIADATGASADGGVDDEGNPIVKRLIPAGAKISFKVEFETLGEFNACMKAFDGWAIATTACKVTAADGTVVWDGDPKYEVEGELMDPWWAVMGLEEGVVYTFEYTLGAADVASWAYGALFQAWGGGTFTMGPVTVEFDATALYEEGENNTEGPTTFDGGIVAYALTGLVGMAGAVVVSKKKR